ncbi:hypothetical protein [Gelidibacter salicanalis]|uniref:DUF4890 domain-containing protein n=1 Tax=Gelidibacter salicanalis TaxID=291193 RepID=A0A934NIL9_9FLAO|nr:hypothetical protein [Gelidibacter salicanalis]MBJ7880229.1 hypothetical protein [Gelidibacter salicanalis]
MKKLVMILVAFATLQVSAQEQKREMRKDHAESKMQYSPEEMAQLRTKQMTLKLDLNDKQQKDVSVIFLEEAKFRANKKAAMTKDKGEQSLSKEERLKMKNERLDRQIAMKKKMKTILSAEQYEKWEKMGQKRGHKGAHKKGPNKTKQ